MRREVSAVLVTRGNVDLGPALDPILAAGIEDIGIRIGHEGVWERYRGARRALHDTVYVQDDDCIVEVEQILAAFDEEYVTVNMPEWKRPEYPPHVALVGWGAVFSKRMLAAFERYMCRGGALDALFRREADRVFTGLNPLKRIDVPFQNLFWARGKDRMGEQPGHGQAFREIVRRIDLIRAQGQPA